MNQKPTSRARGQLRAKAPLRARLQARSKPKPKAKAKDRAKDRARVKANRKVRVKVRRRVRESPANPPPERGRDRGAAKASHHPGSQANPNPLGKGKVGVKDKVNQTRERVKGVALMARPVAGIASRVDAGARRLP